jgi:tetratricopeptide (TPR) repeat protein
MNNFKTVLLFLLVFTTYNPLWAQSNAYDKLGMQAMMKGDFKGAVNLLQKADAKSPNNTNVLKMLGYSYFQSNNYEQSISTYTKLISLKPTDHSSYYYRGKARQNIANDPKEALNQLREVFYQGAISDFTKAIELNGEENAQLLQNRGIAYKDYAIFKSYKIKKKTDKVACVTLFNNASADFQKILILQPQRKDILSLVSYVKDQVASLK